MVWPWWNFSRGVVVTTALPIGGSSVGNQFLMMARTPPSEMQRNHGVDRGAVGESRV
jgi:hypothetical protein